MSFFLLGGSSKWASVFPFPCETTQKLQTRTDELESDLRPRAAGQEITDVSVTTDSWPGAQRRPMRLRFGAANSTFGDAAVGTQMCVFFGLSLSVTPLDFE